MIHELDTVVLTHDIEEDDLHQGDRGAIVHCYSDGSAFEVKFVATDGQTLALLTLTEADIQPMSDRASFNCRHLIQAGKSRNYFPLVVSGSSREGAATASPDSGSHGYVKVSEGLATALLEQI